MFGNLKAEMGRNDYGIKELSIKSGIKENTLRDKLTGKCEFKRNEMFLIKNCFPDKTILYLFFDEE